MTKGLCNIYILITLSVSNILTSFHLKLATLSTYLYLLQLHYLCCVWGNKTFSSFILTYEVTSTYDLLL